MKSPTSTPPKTMFASNGLTEHVLRGVVGAGFLYFAIDISAERPFASLVLVGLALVALRGCPVCWAIGLVETMWRKVRVLGKNAGDAERA